MLRYNSLKKNIKIEKDKIITTSANLDGITMTWKIAFTSFDENIRNQASAFLREIYTALFKDGKADLASVVKSFTGYALKEAQSDSKINKQKIQHFVKMTQDFLEPYFGWSNVKKG